MMKRVKVLAPKVKGWAPRGLRSNSSGDVQRDQLQRMNRGRLASLVRDILSEGHEDSSHVDTGSMSKEDMIQVILNGKGLQQRSKAIAGTMFETDGRLEDEDRKLVYKVLTDNGPDVDYFGAKLGRLVGQARKAGVIKRGYDAVYKWLEDQGMFGPKSDNLRNSGDRYY